MRITHGGAFLTLCLVAAGLLAGCDTFAPEASSTPATLTSGIHGIVLLGPTCSKPVAASPCLEAYSARLVIFDPDGRVVGDVSSNADGSFQLSLPPGDYVIQPAAGGDPFPRAEAQNVTVVEGELTEVEIDYESRDRANDTSR
jgi:hypothetical protein